MTRKPQACNRRHLWPQDSLSSTVTAHFARYAGCSSKERKVMAARRHSLISEELQATRRRSITVRLTWREVRMLLEMMMRSQKSMWKNWQIM